MVVAAGFNEVYPKQGLNRWIYPTVLRSVAGEDNRGAFCRKLPELCLQGIDIWIVKGPYIQPEINGS